MTLTETETGAESGATDIDSALSSIYDEGETAEQSAAPEPDAPAEQTLPPTEEDDTVYPVSWSPAMKEGFKAMPAEIKEYVLNREAQAAGIIGRVDGERRIGKQFTEMLKPYAAEFNDFKDGLPMNEMKDMMRGLHTLSKGDNQAKLNVIANLSRAYNVDLRPLFGERENTLDNSQNGGYDFSQVLSPLQQKMQSLEQFMNSFQAQQNSYIESVAEREAYSAINDTDNFPFLRELSEPTAALVESGYEIKDAYQMALAQSPAHFNKLINQRVEAELQKKQAALQAKTAKGKNLIGSFAPDNGGKSSPSADLDERLSAIFDAGA